MDDLVRALYQDRAAESDTLAILVMESEPSKIHVTDRFNITILVIKDHYTYNWNVKHYHLQDKTCALYIIDAYTLQRALLTGNHRRLVEWLVHGKTVFDRNEFLHSFKQRMEAFPIEERSKKLVLHYAKLLRRFEEGKVLYQEGHYLDAYNFMMHALHHLARLSVTEHGFYPEVTVWEQVRQIEPETYKLLHELIVGEDSVEKRVELLLIALEFAISEKTEVGSYELLKLIEEQSEPIMIQNLLNDPRVEDYRIDLELLVNHLVNKKLVTVSLKQSKVAGIYHRQYSVKRNAEKGLTLI
jgi:hypothetical protein